MADPVDIDGWSMGLRLGDPLLRFDAILATTSLGVSDLRQHPSLQAVAKNLSIFWLPIHHSNFHDLRSRDPTAEVHVVGTHTVHRDPPLYAQLQRTVREVTAGKARFVHLNPAKSFAATEGRIITPRQIDDLYQEISSLDVAICKMSGCQSNWWFCSRWRTGQRLVNLLSLGIPTVVWGDARGNMDVLEGRWPPSDLFGDGSEFGVLARCRCSIHLSLSYAETEMRRILIRPRSSQEQISCELQLGLGVSTPEICERHRLGALRLVLQNATLRALAREQGPRVHFAGFRAGIREKTLTLSSLPSVAALGHKSFTRCWTGLQLAKRFTLQKISSRIVLRLGLLLFLLLRKKPSEQRSAWSIH
ncbi:ZDHHC2 [Symbiodinium necroappetens]|uniref:ZDHHC2 protein n=1 Tax=Symbiodinium necroappetens TaxID=1628268 RepID=A0A812MKJ1_9DINO|nr:ZDHHC2 [Symbiodinium necroappetens]